MNLSSPHPPLECRYEFHPAVIAESHAAAGGGSGAEGFAKRAGVVNVDRALLATIGGIPDFEQRPGSLMMAAEDSW